MKLKVESRKSKGLRSEGLIRQLADEGLKSEGQKKD